MRLRTDGELAVGVRTVNSYDLPLDRAAYYWDHGDMSVNAPTLDNPLESAIVELQAIADDRELFKSSIDAGSLRRMVVHLANINRSVLASTQDHVNASKRLNDFAFTLTRMAKNAELPNDVLTARMALVAAALRAASEELAGSNAVPNWRAPAHASPP